jgi:hypothetical protein
MAYNIGVKERKRKFRKGKEKCSRPETISDSVTLERFVTAGLKRSEPTTPPFSGWWSIP